MTDTATTLFEEHRHELFALAYRMLGSVADAEDLVQDVWLRWSAQDPTTIDRPKGWLITVTSRAAVDRLRSARARREAYVGPWLPEPIVSSETDPAELVAMADSLSLAFLGLLERLDPVERAAFLLREVFREDYAVIADALGRTEVACRQIVHRAKERIGPDRPVRFDPAPHEERRLVESFLAAAVAGDLDALHEVLTDDVVAWSDGGAQRHAARRPVVGRHRVAILVRGITRRGLALGDEIEVRNVRVNGDPGVTVLVDGRLSMVMAFEIGPAGICGIRTILNPDKLAHLDRGEPPVG
ncbi:MAG: RNA polymerase sigma-70 factor [Acidimicrobiales bacterium]